MEKDEIKQKGIKEKSRGRKKIQLPIDEIISEFEKGTKQIILARKYNVSNAKMSCEINQYYRDRGLDKKEAKNKEKEKSKKKVYLEAKKLPMEVIIEKLSRGAYKIDLCREYNVSYTTLNKKLKRYYEEQGEEMPLRKRGRRKKNLPKKEKKTLDIEEFIKNYEEGCVQTQLAKKYNISQTRVSTIIRKYYKENDKQRPKHKSGPKTNEINIDDIITKFENGISQAQLARDYGISEITMEKNISKFYQSQERTKPKILTNVRIIVQYMKKGLTIDQINQTAKNKNVIIPPHVIVRAVGMISKKYNEEERD